MWGWPETLRAKCLHSNHSPEPESMRVSCRVMNPNHGQGHCWRLSVDNSFGKNRGKTDVWIFWSTMLPTVLKSTWSCLVTSAFVSCPVCFTYSSLRWNWIFTRSLLELATFSAARSSLYCMFSMFSKFSSSLLIVECPTTFENLDCELFDPGRWNFWGFLSDF